jgi:hypothetical protein
MVASKLKESGPLTIKGDHHADCRQSEVQVLCQEKISGKAC